MITHGSSSVSVSSLDHGVPVSNRNEKVFLLGKKSENLALAITMVVLAVLLIVAGLAALFLLPHFGIVVSPLFALLAIPVLVGLVKIALAIFVLHKPVKQEVSQEVKVLEEEIKEMLGRLAVSIKSDSQSSSEKP